jgi:hypothetical protein
MPSCAFAGRNVIWRHGSAREISNARTERHLHRSLGRGERHGAIGGDTVVVGVVLRAGRRGLRWGRWRARGGLRGCADHAPVLPAGYSAAPVRASVHGQLLHRGRAVQRARPLRAHPVHRRLRVPRRAVLPPRRQGSRSERLRADAVHDGLRVRGRRGVRSEPGLDPRCTRLPATPLRRGVRVPPGDDLRPRRPLGAQRLPLLRGLRLPG